MNNNILKNLRKKNNLTQAELAEKIGVSTSTVGMYEQGRRHPDNKVLIKISKIFNVTTDYMLGVSSFKQNTQYIIEKETKDLDDVLNNLKKTLLSNDIIFEQKKLNKQDIEKIITAIMTGVTVAVSNK